MPVYKGAPGFADSLPPPPSSRIEPCPPSSLRTSACTVRYKRLGPIACCSADVNAYSQGRLSSPTGAFSCSVMTRMSASARRIIETFILSYSGIAGGAVKSVYFQVEFGMRPATGPSDSTRINNISQNVVSVLMAGALFGALGSAPISCTLFD